MKTKTVKLNRHVEMTFTPYRSQFWDVWINVNERLPNGDHTEKQNHYPVKIAKLEKLRDMIDKVLRAEKQKRS